MRTSWLDFSGKAFDLVNHWILLKGCRGTCQKWEMKWFQNLFAG